MVVADYSWEPACQTARESISALSVLKETLLTSTRFAFYSEGHP